LLHGYYSHFNATTGSSAPDFLHHTTPFSCSAGVAFSGKWISGSQVPWKSLYYVHATSMPDAAQAELILPLELYSQPPLNMFGFDII
jgi:hypothetical protein